MELNQHLSSACSADAILSEIVKAFLGPARAAFYQVFAWTFNASLKKEYRPEDDDKLVERVVRQVEAGIL